MHGWRQWSGNGKFLLLKLRTYVHAWVRQWSGWKVFAIANMHAGGQFLYLFMRGWRICSVHSCTGLVRPGKFCLIIIIIIIIICSEEVKHPPAKKVPAPAKKKSAVSAKNKPTKSL